jgi:hypothetical protein
MSSLTNERIYVDNWSSRNGRPICKITPHHMAGNLSLQTCANVLQNSGASANYCIDSEGRIACLVDEDCRSWCSYSYDNDSQAITIEVANDGGAPDWHVSDAAFNSLVNLSADICQRFGFRLVYDETPNGSLTRHNMFMATTCPGPYLQSKFPELVQRVNEILDGGNSKLKYQGHVQDIGWMDWVRNGQLCGTTGQSRRLEALRIDYPEEIQEIAVHVAFDGWKYYKKPTKDTIIGTTGESKAIECIRIKALKEDGSPRFKFRVHLAEFGWTPFTISDGISTLGTVGQSLQIEAIEIEEI